MGKAKARIAVLGCGWWTQGWHCPHLTANPDCELVAVVDPNPTPRSAIPPQLLPVADLAAKHGCRSFGSFDDLLSSDCRVDGVIVCTSHASHAELGAKALDHGLHVLMEKPMTTDVGEARALVKASSAHPELFFCVNNTASWRPQALVASEWVRAGRIGAVQHVLCAFHCPLLWLFDDPNNVGWTQLTGGMVGNGFAWGQCSHLLAWVLQATGLEPVSVFCAMTWSERSGADLADAATFVASCGATISLSGTCCVPGNAHGSEGAAGKHVSLRVFGGEGSIEYEGDDQRPDSGRLLLRRRDGEIDCREGFLFEDYDQGGVGPGSVQALIAACRGEAHTAAVGAALGARVVRCIEAMYRSARDGRAVDIAPPYGHPGARAGGVRRAGGTTPAAVRTGWWAGLRGG